VHPLKKAESWLREVRSFVLPSHIRMYRRIRAERSSPGGAVPAPIAVLDLGSLKSDADAGRFVYLTCRRLFARGYSVVFTDHFRTIANFQARRYKQLLFNHPFHVADDPARLNPTQGLWITDSRRELEVRRARGWSVVLINYEHRLPRAVNEVAHTFSMHPDVYEFAPLISRERALSGEDRWTRIFFAGNTSPRAYSEDRMGKGHEVMTRVETVARARRAAGDALTVVHARECEAWTPAHGRLRFAMIDTTIASIEARYWAHVLSGAEFFLAAPGASFPLSHNAVEAMYAGAIPIIQYPQYFDPPLEHGVNCITFRDGAELESRVREVLAMDPDRIASIRRGSVEYHERYLRLEPLIDRLRDTATAHGHAVWMYFSFTAPVKGRAGVPAILF
jgi:hypothetical protein